MTELRANALCRQRNRSEDTLDSVSGENVGEVVVAVLTEDHKRTIAELEAKLEGLEASLKLKEQELAEAALSSNMKREQIESLEGLVTSLRGEYLSLDRYMNVSDRPHT